ncbi:hypothetical protein, partial [Mesorhizobium sp. M4B.F.Ca.ET.049.02.1.2]|uniref:hypothetical protein n=1 Tax=Mesorhizobium sp. M4B.F.Ca.ET.049.02.1.2 TaxID=2496752 RepID=UPI001FDFA211
SNRVAWARPIDERLCNPNQTLVSLGVSVPIVDGREVIRIDQKKCVTFSFVAASVHPGHEPTATKESRHRIMAG